MQQTKKTVNKLRNFDDAHHTINMLMLTLEIEIVYKAYSRQTENSPSFIQGGPSGATDS